MVHCVDVGRFSIYMRFEVVVELHSLVALHFYVDKVFRGDIVLEYVEPLPPRFDTVHPCVGVICCAQFAVSISPADDCSFGQSSNCITLVRLNDSSGKFRITLAPPVLPRLVARS